MISATHWSQFNTVGVHVQLLSMSDFVNPFLHSKHVAGSVIQAAQPMGSPGLQMQVPALV